MSSHHSDINEAKHELQEIVSNLSEARARLSDFIEKLPERGKGDELLAELRLAAREAKNDLLKDAITILQAAIDLGSLGEGEEATE